MSIDRTVYAIYGVRVPDDTDWMAVEQMTGQCLNNGMVGVFRAGRYNHHMTFLARSWRRVVAGEYVYHDGEKPNMTKFERDHWNDELRSVADNLGLEITDGPGWFTIPSEA